MNKRALRRCLNFIPGHFSGPSIFISIHIWERQTMRINAKEIEVMHIRSPELRKILYIQRQKQVTAAFVPFQASRRPSLMGALGCTMRLVLDFWASELWSVRTVCCFKPLTTLRLVTAGNQWSSFLSTLLTCSCISLELSGLCVFPFNSAYCSFLLFYSWHKYNPSFLFV